jgi:indole-3-glycerol phosphate synthase
MPVMRKDFLVDIKQILETRMSGASGVLLITAILSDKELKQMLDCCYEYSLFVLLESFNIDDVKRSSKLLKMTRYSDRAVKGDLLFGINTRNLRNLEVNIKRLEILSSHLPEDGIWVAESGISNISDVANLTDIGYSMALVGTALMKSKDPSGFISEMLDVGREAIRQ